MRPVWGDRSFFFARAIFGTLAALVLVAWAIGAPRVLSPNRAPPPAAPNKTASKPLRVPIGSFLHAKPSISNKPRLSKHASGSYSSGVAGVETRVIKPAASNHVAYTITGARANSAPKRSHRINNGGSKTTTTSPPTVTTTPPPSTTPAVTTTTPVNPAPVVTPGAPGTKPRTTPSATPS